MALVLKDRVQETTTTSGTGTLTLAGAVSGFDTFSASIGNGNVTYYTIFDNTAYTWEVGIGTVGAGTLARTTVLSNSSGTTSPINLAGNVAFVFCTYPAEKSINYDTNDVATIGETLGYSDSGIIASFASTVAGYNQVVLQNKSTATNASTNFNVSNDVGTAGSNYAELGINSSTFTGTGSFNIAGASYVASASTDLTLGTYGAYSIHFVTNSGTTDAMTIFNNGGISLGGFSNPGIGNMAASKFVPGFTAVTAAAGTTVLTASSNYYQNLLGTTTQTFQLPDATGLLVGTTFIFDNDSTGTLTVVDNASGPIDTIPSGALGYVYLANNSTVAGTWRRHAFLPASYDFNNTTANFGNATITSAVWNGTTIASGYGGTGLTTFTGANNALYSTNATTLVAGTLPVAAGGTGLTSLTAGRIPYGDGTNPFGSSANLFWDSANNWLGIGTSAPSQKVTINSNTVLPSAGSPATSNIWSVGADAVVNAHVLDSFGAQNSILARRAGGTSSSPTALASGDTIFQFAGRGYGATAYSASARAQFTFVASEAWTNTAQGTYIAFNTTLNGTTTAAEKMRILDSGAISFGSSGTAYGTSGQVLTSNGNATPTWTSLSSSAVTSFSAGTTGFTPNSATTGAVTLAGTLNVANGGTGQTTAAAAYNALNPMTTVGDIIYEATGPAAARLPIGTTGQVLTVSGGIPSWQTVASNVSSFQTSLSGLTPSTATTGAVTLAGTLGPTSGGTGTSTAFTTGSVVFAGASGVYSQNNANFFWDNTNSRLGIGTSSPTARLDVRTAAGTPAQMNLYSGDNTTVSRLSIGQVASIDWDIGLTSTSGNFQIGGLGGSVSTAYSILRAGTAINAHAWNTSGTERMRIDSSGKVLVNTSTARANFFNSTFSPTVQVEGTSFDTASYSAVRNANDTSAPNIVLAKSRGTTVGSNTIVQSGDGVGVISFQGNDGTEFVESARITGVIDGTPGANDMPGGLTFATTADGAASVTERMRIDSAGNVRVEKAARGTVLTNNTLSFDMNASSNFSCTPSALGTLTFTNITSGQSGFILLINTGGFAISAAATTEVSATTLTTISTAGTYLLSYFSNGTNVFVTNSGALA